MLDDVRAELQAIEAQVVAMGATLDDVRPQKRELRWFANRHSYVWRARVHQGAKDALNHAAAMRGYFDGYAARGAFQERTAARSEATEVRTLEALLDYVAWVLSEILAVVRELLARTTLELCAVGPKKPGPMRTAAVCQEHLSSLEHKACLMVMDVARSPALRARVARHLPE